MDQVLKEADFVSLHLPLMPETRGFINKERLALMKPTAILVNTARGAIIDEAALAGHAEGRGRSTAPGWTSTPPSRRRTARCWAARGR